MKHSALRTQDGALYDGKTSSDDEIVASSSGIIAIFLRHLPDSPTFQEAFNSLKRFLNSLDLGVLCEVHADDTQDAHMVKTPVVREKAIASRQLEMLSPTSKSLPSERVDQDTGCFLLTPPSSNKKVSLSF